MNTCVSQISYGVPSQYGRSNDIRKSYLSNMPHMVFVPRLSSNRHDVSNSTQLLAIKRYARQSGVLPLEKNASQISPAKRLGETEVRCLPFVFARN